jgi:ATP-dependent Lon protease
VAVSSLAEPLQLVMDNGAKKVLLPTTNKRDFLEVPGDIVERVDSLFYSDPIQASLKALGST